MYRLVWFVAAAVTLVPAFVFAQSAPAHVVLVSAEDEAAANALLERYRAERLPSAGEVYPQAASTDSGWALLVAAPTDESVATALVTHLQARGWQGLSTVARDADDAQDLGALVVASNGPVGDEEWRWVGPVRLSVDQGSVGRAQPAADNALLILYSWAGAWPADGILSAGGSAEFPYECDEWAVPAATNEQRVHRVTLGISTATCFQHG